MKKLEKILFHLPENLVIIFVTIAIGLLVLVACAPAPTPPPQFATIPQGTKEPVGDYCALEIKEQNIIRSYATDYVRASDTILNAISTVNGIESRYFYASGTGDLFLVIVHTSSCSYAESVFLNGN